MSDRSALLVRIGSFACGIGGDGGPCDRTRCGDTGGSGGLPAGIGHLDRGGDAVRSGAVGGRRSTGGGVGAVTTGRSGGRLGAARCRGRRRLPGGATLRVRRLRLAGGLVVRWVGPPRPRDRTGSRACGAPPVREPQPAVGREPGVVDQADHPRLDPDRVAGDVRRDSALERRVVPAEPAQPGDRTALVATHPDPTHVAQPAHAGHPDEQARDAVRPARIDRAPPPDEHPPDARHRHPHPQR